MFHLELRQFPHVSRVFNLTREELDRRFALPWAAGRPLEHEERRWDPARARLTIYEGPELAVEQMGLGRGWANASRSGSEVTAAVLAEAERGAGAGAALGRFKERLRTAAAADAAVPLSRAMGLAQEAHPGWRPSERLGLVEQAVWELLHEGALCLHGPEGAVPRQQWRALLLSWATWSETGRGWRLVAAEAQAP